MEKINMICLPKNYEKLRNIMEKEQESEKPGFLSIPQLNRIQPDLSNEINEKNPNHQHHPSMSSMSTIGKTFSKGRKVNLKRVSGPLNENTLKGVAEYILSGRCKKIVILTGAGISTSAGIPDFRSPSIGIYNIIEKWGMLSPQSVFDIDYFRINPYPFYTICSNYINVVDNAKPTLSHCFIKLLADKNILLRVYTQNVDGMERLTGIDSKILVEAHGNLLSSSCINCHKNYDIQLFKENLILNKICYCLNCNDLIKPDIVFFGEKLPENFFENVENDCKNCDMMIVSGTSLHVYPISIITQLIPPDVPRVLINNEKVSPFNIDEDNSPIIQSECSSVNDIKKDIKSFNDETFIDRFSISDDFYDETSDIMELPIYNRDVTYIGNADDGFKTLAIHLGWEDQLLQLYHNFQNK